MDTPEMVDVRKMNDWRLNELAGALEGYRLERVPIMFGDREMGHEHRLVRPDGTSYRLDVNEKYLDQEFRERLPDYLDDIDWATHLLHDLCWKLIHDNTKPDTFYCWIEWGPETDYGHKYEVEETHTEPLRAMVQAWIAYKIRCVQIAQVGAA